MPSTGVLMRLMEIDGDDHSVDEVILQPGAVANWLRFPNTRAEHKAMSEGATLEIATGRAGSFGPSKVKSLAVRKATVVTKGEWHRVANPTQHALTLQVTLKPTWNPQRAYFSLNDKQFRGDEVWFEVKTHVGDTTARAMYQLHQLSAGRGNVSVRLAPGAQSIETFHRKATVKVTGVEGTGVLRVDRTDREIRPEVAVAINPGQHYQLLNKSNKPFQVSQVHTPQWEPHDTFYLSEEKMIPGNHVWFEFVVP